MAKTEEDKHQAGGPGKDSRKGHIDPEDSGNKPGQKQTPTERGPGQGGGQDPERRPGG